MEVRMIDQEMAALCRVAATARSGGLAEKVSHETEIPELALPFAAQPDSFAFRFGERHA